MKVYLNVTFGTFSLGNAIPYLENFADARGAAYAIYKIIDRVRSLFCCCIIKTC